MHSYIIKSMLAFHKKIKVQFPVKADIYFDGSTMTTYTTVIMQMSQNRLKSRLKDFHIRLKYLSIVDHKVTDQLIMHLSTGHLNALLKAFTPIESGARSM